MAAHDPRSAYRDRQAHWNAEIAKHDRRHLLVSNLRLALVAAVVALLWLAAQQHVPGRLLVVPIVTFFALLPMHARVLNARDRAVRARGYYDRGMARLHETWKE